jgi:hypothetical protein
MLMIASAVRDQYHCFLLFHSLHRGRRICHIGTARLLGLWIGQLCFCLACNLDNRYLRKTNFAALHLPTDGVDAACRRILFLDSRVEQGTFGLNRHVHLLVCCVLFARRRSSGECLWFLKTVEVDGSMSAR